MAPGDISSSPVPPPPPLQASSHWSISQSRGGRPEDFDWSTACGLIIMVDLFYLHSLVCIKNGKNRVYFLTTNSAFRPNIQYTTLVFIVQSDKFYKKSFLKYLLYLNMQLYDIYYERQHTIQVLFKEISFTSVIAMKQNKRVQLPIVFLQLPLYNKCISIKKASSETKR